MHGANEFLQALAITLGVAAVTTVVFQRLHQPVVLGYLIAGLIVGPHVPVPLVADDKIIRTLSELGVILLMFSLGLEFSIRKLLRVGTTAGVIALLECSLMVWLGYTAGRLAGWTPRESVFAGAIVAISSTTIVAKAFEERGVRGKLRELVVGILIVEDLIAVVLVTTLTAVSSTRGLSAEALGNTILRLAAFLVGIVAVGMLVVPRAVRFVNKLKRPETTLVAAIGFCFSLALVAQAAGYSVALGAFLAGTLVAESGEAPRVERLVLPVRDMFAAIFFVSVGMLLDPRVVAEHWHAVVALTTIVVLGKIAGVSLGAFLTGNGTRTSVQAGMSLAQIGEFSFIIAGLGVTLGATGDFLYPVAIAVSAVTTLLTPWLIRASGPVANWVDRRAPHRLQTFSALYGTWVESLGKRRRDKGMRARIRRAIWLLCADAACLAAVVIATSTWREELISLLVQGTGLSENTAAAAVLIGAFALAGPFVFGFVRLARRLGATLADLAFPPGAAGGADTAAAPRRALVVTLQLAAALLIGAPLLALTQPFFPDFHYQVLLLVFVLAVLGLAFWRSAASLHGHVRAGAQVIVEALAAQSRGGDTTGPVAVQLPDLHALLPGLGDPVPVRLDAGDPAVGRTLAEINLRGATGATVLAIVRGEQGVIVPTARERLQAGDVLALAGTREAVEAAGALLKKGV